jgi:hypothetical protein
LWAAVQDTISFAATPFVNDTTFFFLQHWRRLTQQPLEHAMLRKHYCFLVS